MSDKPTTFTATVEWRRGGQDFAGKRYSRAHTWTFDGGAVVPGSSSPHSVPLPYSDETAVDPEEALVAAVSSCHMLFFLSGLARKGYTLDNYTDHAEAVMEKNARGKVAITRVTLRPALAFSGDKRPSAREIDALHHWAHGECYIANSINAEVVVEPQEQS